MDREADSRGRTRRRARGHPWLTLAAVALGVMMVAVDGTVVSVANPTIGRDLGASLEGLQWVTNAYLLTLAVLLIVGGKVGDRFGRRLCFSIGVVAFALASVGCALSHSIGALIAFRALQGIGGALLMPNSLAILRASFPPDALDRAVGIWAGSSALATASGPIVGGLLVEHVSWQSIFLINVPFAIAALAFTLAVVAETREPDSAHGLDAPGVVLLTAGLWCLVWGLIKSQSHGWGSGYTLGFLVLSAVVLAAFAAREASARHPIIPLWLFRSRSLSAGVTLVAIAFFAMFGVLFFITLYLQRVHDYTPVQAGVRLLPLTAVFSLSAPLGGLLTQRFGPRPPLVGGLALLGAAMLGLRGLGLATPYSEIWPWLLAAGVALGLVVVASTQAIVGSAPVALAGVAGGLQTTAMQVGGVLGTAVLGAVLVSRVGATFAGHLTDAGVPSAAARSLGSAKEAVAQGLAPVDQSMPSALAHDVARASFQAFLDGLDTAMLVAGLVAFAGAALALAVGRGPAAAPSQADAPALNGQPGAHKLTAPSSVLGNRTP